MTSRLQREIRFTNPHHLIQIINNHWGDSYPGGESMSLKRRCWFSASAKGTCHRAVRRKFMKRPYDSAEIVMQESLEWSEYFSTDSYGPHILEDIHRDDISIILMTY